MTQIDKLAEHARGDIDPSLLTSSKSTDSDGVLMRPAIEYINPSEAIQFVFHNVTKGITLKNSDSLGNTKKVKPDRGCTLLIITDQAVHILVGDVQGQNKDMAERIPLFQISDINAAEGFFKNSITLVTDQWTYKIPVKRDDDVTAGSKYIKNRLEGDLESSTPTARWTVDKLYSVEPTTFESILTHLWRQKGYRAKTTDRSGDKGIDVIAATDDEKILIQAKRYKPTSNKVGIRHVQRAAGLLSDTEFNPSEVVVATTSVFTQQAEERASNIQKLRLLTGDDIAASLREYDIPPSKFNIKETADEPRSRSPLDSAETTDGKNSDDITQQQREPSVFAEGIHLVINLTGFWPVNQNHVYVGQPRPSDGWYLTATIYNKSNDAWDWRAYEALTIVDEEGIAYTPTNKLKSKGLPGGWQTGRIKIQPDTKVQYLGLIELPRDATISRVRYTEKVIHGTDVDPISISKSSRDQLRALHEKEELDITIASEVHDQLTCPPPGLR